MSVRQDKPAAQPGMMPALEFQAGAESTNEALGEGNSFAVAAPDHPLKRNVVVSIKASLNDLCLQKARGTWAPSQEALRSICKYNHSNHFGHGHARLTDGDTERACCSLAQSSRRSCKSSPRLPEPAPTLTAMNPPTRHATANPCSAGPHS
jgi:hypothetical protein